MDTLSIEIERFWHGLKCECINLHAFQTRSEARVTDGVDRPLQHRTAPLGPTLDRSTGMEPRRSAKRSHRRERIRKATSKGPKR